MNHCSFDLPLPRAVVLPVLRLVGPLSVFVALLALAGCATVPLDVPRTPSTAIAETGNTDLARYSAAWRSERPDADGFYPLSSGLDAFGARLSLIDSAEVSLDAQYFLMKPDDAGLVFASELLEAAERGVRVRLLLDDVFTTVSDKGLALLDTHRNIEVRIFNPVARQGVYALNYVGNFELANRRMHNKSFIADNQLAIVGGRNIAVEYFQLETTGEFMDFDMLAAGPIVREVSRSFDEYWNDELAVPFEVLHREDDPEEVRRGMALVRREMAAAGDSIYAAAINTELMRAFYADSIDPFHASARLVTDDPEKLRQEISTEHQVAAQSIRNALLAAEREIIVFTPYFIPRDRGLEVIRKIRDRGVRVVLVTNSLATNNHTAVHSAYSRYRKDVLQAGVELWEARADAAKITADDGSTALERLTLHTKGMIIDRRLVIAGSLNLDPRSIDINTELALFVESEEMAGRLSDSALEMIPTIAYRLQLDDRDRITWHANIDGREVVETSEPQASWWRRFSAWFQRIAPEDQL
jgi:putative cardiolipin synthase